MEELEKIKKKTKLYKMLMIIQIIIFLVVARPLVIMIIDFSQCHGGSALVNHTNDQEILAFNSKFEAYEGERVRRFTSQTFNR